MKNVTYAIDYEALGIISDIEYYKLQYLHRLLVFKTLPFETLVALRKKKLRPLPLLMTHANIKESLDVFPLEFLTITDRYVVKAGKDIFKGVKIEARHVRHQVEFELRSKIIHFRSQYAVADKAVEKDFLFTIMPILHGLLYLAGKQRFEMPYDLTLLEKTTETDLGPLRELWDGRRVEPKALYSVLASLAAQADKVR
ncbi:MAG: hypothetical protein ABIH41_04485 [Nanoarchaeota archaeon]